jgi:hypothetical protein
MEIIIKLDDLIIILVLVFASGSVHGALMLFLGVYIALRRKGII